MPLLAFLAGCPDDTPPCTPTAGEPRAVAEPSLGEHRARITWLHSGEVTDFTVQASAPDEAHEQRSCNGKPSVLASYTLHSSDGAIEELVELFEDVESSGTFSTRQLVVTLDAQRLLRAGVAPDHPGLAERSPRATLTLLRPVAFEEGTIVVDTTEDHLTLGLVEFGAP